jgi:hypothetical protein
MKIITTTMCMAIGALAACGPAAPDQGTTVGNQEPAPARAAATPCPQGAELEAAAMKAWGKTGGSVYAQCVAASVGGETLWLIDGTYEAPPSDDNFMMGMWTALVTPAGEVRWTQGDDELPYGAVERSYSQDYQAADLDGDGNDEIVHVAGYSHSGFDESSLVVLKVTATGVEMMQTTIALSADNSAADVDPSELQTCDGAYQLVDAGGGKKRIEVTYTGQCERTGTVAWTFDGQALTQNAP